MPEPSFDKWTSLFLLFAFQSMLSGGVLFWMRRGNRPANRSLALLLLSFALTLVDYELYWTHYNLVFTWYAGIGAALPFLFGPLIWLYGRRIAGDANPRRMDAPHLLPFALCLVYMAPWFLTGGEAKRQFILHGPQDWPAWRKALDMAIPWLQIIHMAIYLFLAYRLFANMGALQHMRVWTRGLLICFTGYVIAYGSYFALARMPFFNPQWDYGISFAMAVFILFIGVFGFVQPAVFDGHAVTEVREILLPPPRYANSGLTPGAATELYACLEQHMRSAQPYRDNAIRLETLAKQLGTTKHALSQVINERSGTNFFGYVNHYRIDEAKRVLASTSRDELRVNEVAYQVGFNTKAAFNAAFKRSTGMTPTAYRSSAKE